MNKLNIHTYKHKMPIIYYETLLHSVKNLLSSFFTFTNIIRILLQNKSQSCRNRDHSWPQTDRLLIDPLMKSRGVTHVLNSEFVKGIFSVLTKQHLEVLVIEFIFHSIK